MRVRYEEKRGRVIAGGLDNQLKFFEVSNLGELKLAYKVKVPSEIFCMDVSPDGNHYSIGLNDGSLLIKSKLLESLTTELDEETKLIQSLEPERRVSTSKNYRYFFRGQY